MNSTASNQPYFISTTIPYVNGPPHIGHAFEFVQADAIARYQRLRGDDVRFVSGTDENSLKNARAAESEGVETSELVARNSALYRQLGATLDLSYDDFIRTSADRRHIDAVHKIWALCEARGDVYRKAYSGLYCVGCEQFYRPAELNAGVCPEHGREPELVAEENYFFRLSRYGDQVAEILRSGRVRVEPVERRNEAIAFAASGLEDFSISRSRARAKHWGISVPNDPAEVVYVWFDALVNYLSVLDFAGEGELERRFWAGPGRRVHVLGKGVLRFHAVYWPAILLSAGLPLPSELLVHGYLTVEGNKIGKSLGNVLDPGALVAEYGADAVRYYLLRHQHSTKDGDFSRARLVEAHDAELADQLGNLLNRLVSLADRYYSGRIPESRGAAPPELVRGLEAARTDVEEAFDRFALHEALRAICELVAEGNRYFDRVQPWNLAKQIDTSGDALGRARAQRELAEVLSNASELLRAIAVLTSPFLPRAASELFERLGSAAVGPGAWSSAARFREVRTEQRVKKGPVLFPKLARRSV